MLTHISIENFKGIRDRVEIELKPITLLFGPNSAGKSTVLHALLYAQEVFERHNLNADVASTGGSFVDLGGFENLVHGHDRTLSITLGLQFKFNENEWRDYTGHQKLLKDHPASEAYVLLDEPTQGGVSLTICWSEKNRQPFVKKCIFQLESSDLVEITTDADAGETALRILHPDHPLFARPRLVCKEAGPALVQPSEPRKLPVPKMPIRRTSIFHSLLQSASSPSAPYRIRILDQEDALPSAHGKVRLHLPPRYVQSPPGIPRMPSKTPTKDVVICGLLESALTNILEALRSRLSDFRYLGPVREIPPRNMIPQKSPDTSRWATGLGAWDHLHNCEAEFFDRVSDWLSNPKRLDAGVRLARHEFIPLRLAKKVFSDLFLERVTQKRRDKASDELDKLPLERRVSLVRNDSEIELSLNDVGVGVSQIIPVLVTVLAGNGRLSGMEEPEYHLHPRLQAELGDLLIESSVGGTATFLVETHSEHLILRIQRRIRETTHHRVASDRAVSTNDIAVYHIQQLDGRSEVRRIDVDVNGEFVQPWPDDFFELDFYERFAPC